MENIADKIELAEDVNDEYVYEGSTLDTYLNDTWYNTLTTKAKNALVAKTFTQDQWVIYYLSGIFTM